VYQQMKCFVVAVVARSTGVDSCVSVDVVLLEKMKNYNKSKQIRISKRMNHERVRVRESVSVCAWLGAFASARARVCGWKNYKQAKTTNTNKYRSLPGK